MRRRSNRLFVGVFANSRLAVVRMPRAPSRFGLGAKPAPLWEAKPSDVYIHVLPRTAEDWRRWEAAPRTEFELEEAASLKRKREVWEEELRKELAEEEEFGEAWWENYRQVWENKLPATDRYVLRKKGLV